MGYATTNPYTNEVVRTFPDATDAEVDTALDLAHEAFLSWRETEAIRLANDTQFGLAGSVYSTDIGHAFAVAEQLEAGAVTINQPTMPVASIPFGGVKNSGYGREMGTDGIREFVNHKAINGAQVAGVA